MQKVNVLLLDLKTYYPSPPFQLGLLVEYAKLEPEVRANTAFHFASLPRETPAREVADAVLRSGADLVAASNYAWSYKRLCDALELIERSGATPPRILLGGPNSSGEFGAEMMRRHPSISAMVEGEGEPAFRDICASLVDSPSHDPFATARNCVIRDDTGEVRRPNPNHRIQSLDEVPSPYLSGLLPANPAPIFYETNRGCPYRCSFCYWGNGNAKLYRMSHERIREEMEFFARSRVSSFWIADANFGIFKSDAEIAEMMAEINARHGYPFKHVGVNWAKQSSDRVLEIAKIFRTGRMGCTTTMALQSVTPEAEEASKRYAMAPSKFARLVRRAAEEDLDTYTDIIWGLPGESLDQFLDGLGAVAASGVPAILMHQLYLLPGTEFFEKRHELGLEMLSESDGARGGAGPGLSANARSEFADYIVVRHPRMSRADMVAGTRLLGANHVLHNHDLARVAIAYLARYGLGHREVFEFFDRVITGRVAGFEEPPGTLLGDVRRLIVEFAENVGLDEYTFYYELSEAVWFSRDPSGRRRTRAAEVESFCQRFFSALVAEHDLTLDLDERLLLEEIIRYNALIAPKPTWRPAPEYRFEYDVHSIWVDMQHAIHAAAERVRSVDGAAPNREGCCPEPRRTEGAREEESWPLLGREVVRSLAALLTPEYLASRRSGAAYRIENPWRIAPIVKTADWLLSSRSKHCIVHPVG